MWHPIVLALTTVLCFFGVMACLGFTKRPLNLPDLDIRSPGNQERTAWAMRSIRARRMALVTGYAVGVVQMTFIVVLYVLTKLGGHESFSYYLQAGPFGVMGPWMICLLTAIPVGTYLASENDAKEAREGAEASVLALNPKASWQYQYALARASEPHEAEYLS